MSAALLDLDASELVRLLSRGELSSEEVVRACLEGIARDEPRIGAFEHLDGDRALAAARAVDARRPRPPLAGLPIGVKDVFDTADLLTERGSAAFRGRRPGADAVCVARLREAGAIVLGKTVTTELAFYAPGKTRNPHDPSRTPGGSSSGSAAAVAARLVPAALGTQTAGSMIRPASFCGVIGMKPTFGAVEMTGVSPFAPSLDTFGVFATDLRVLPLLLAAAGAPIGAARLQGPPRVGLCRTEQWPLAEASTRQAVESVAAELAAAGARVVDLELGPAFAGLPAAQRAMMAAEGARTLAELRARHRAQLSQVLLEFLAEGDAVTPAREQQARAQAARCTAALTDVFAQVDVLLTPSAIGEAPVGLASTGDPAFNRIWTLLGTPCLSLPVALGPAGMPVGVQLVAARGCDADLIDAGAWVMEALGDSRRRATPRVAPPG